LEELGENGGLLNEALRPVPASYSLSKASGKTTVFSSHPENEACGGDDKLIYLKWEKMLTMKRWKRC